MEPEDSLPHSQASATRPYPGLTQFYILPLLQKLYEQTGVVGYRDLLNQHTHRQYILV
jgi:hypothetical protein